MTPILRTEMLQPSELQALFGEEKDYSCSLTEIVHNTEECEQQSDCENTAQSVCDFSTLCDPDCGQSCAVSHLHRQVFSNQEYYTKLEELKREHMRNITELEKLYLNQLTPGQKERQLVSSRRERQLSASKANEGETESEQVELTQVGSRGSAVRLKSAASHLNIKQNSFEEIRKSCRSQQNSSHSQLKDRTRETSDILRQNSKITVPKPFHMMLREEERKRRNVKTRSEMELENEMLRKQLDDMKEFGKRFRAKPAPSTTHIPLYDIINKRLSKHQRQKSPINSTHQGHYGNHHHRGPRTPPIPQKPFSFIERERKKKEKKLADEINNLTTKEERKVFKARPVPKSLYRPSSPSYPVYEADSLQTRERQNRRCSVRAPGILEDMLREGENDDKEYANSGLWKWKTKSILQVEEEMERKRSRERERDWSYIHPLRKTSFCQELSHTCKNDYISV